MEDLTEKFNHEAVVEAATEALISLHNGGVETARAVARRQRREVETAHDGPAADFLTDFLTDVIIKLNEIMAHDAAVARIKAESEHTMTSCAWDDEPAVTTDRVDGRPVCARHADPRDVVTDSPQVTMADLAQRLGTDTHTLREFAPDDVSAYGDAQPLSAELVAQLTEAWAETNDEGVHVAPYRPGAAVRYLLTECAKVERAAEGTASFGAITRINEKWRVTRRLTVAAIAAESGMTGIEARDWMTKYLH